MLPELVQIKLFIESQKVLTTVFILLDICKARLECSVLDIRDRISME